MAPLKISRPPGQRIWLDPLPRFSWEYERAGRFRWSGDYGPCVGSDNRIGLRHVTPFFAFTERGIRRKLARKIRAERRDDWQRYVTRRKSP
jgi:hypothetical protein